MRVDRLLSILLIILNRKNVTGKELAEHFEVSLRTIYRDIEKLCEAGVPIAANGGIGGGYYIMENYKLDKSFFNKNEIKPLMAIIDNLGFLFGKNAQFNDLSLKFENLFETDHEELIINLSHFSMEKELKDCLFIISKAIDEKLLVEFSYINRRMELSKRIAEPIQISYRSGEWYLIAYCRNRKDYRQFKLIRIRDIKLGEVFEDRMLSRQAINQIIKDSYYKKSLKVILKFHERIGEQLAEHFSKEAIVRKEDGSYLVEEYFPYEEGLIRFILSFGTACEVIEPKILREEVGIYIKKLYSLYND